MTQGNYYSDYRHSRNRVFIWFLIGCICILYAGRIRYGRDRIHQSKECRYLLCEESDGFLYWNNRVYFPWI